jgi:small subunit ribosomal protein S2
VLALTDTNCDPEVIDYVIPGNDDAIRSISLISRLVADAIIAGRGEEVQVDERPVPPVIEETQVNGEVQQAGTAEATTETPADVPEAPAEPDAIPDAEAADEPSVVVESEVVETEVVEAETGDVEAVEAEADAEPGAEEIETEEAGPVEKVAPDEESEETEEK